MNSSLLGLSKKSSSDALHDLNAHPEAFFWPFKPSGLTARESQSMATTNNWKFWANDPTAFIAPLRDLNQGMESAFVSYFYFFWFSSPLPKQYLLQALVSAKYVKGNG